MIGQFFDFIHTLTDPEKLINLISTVLTGAWAYWFLFAIVFAETGLLVGFVLPGDSLLFTLGVVAGAGELNIGLLIVFLIIAAILGDSFGYALGRKYGPAIFHKPDSFFFKKEYIERTHKFFAKYGPKTVLFARFLPVVRSFAPFMAGVGGMHYRTFFVYNVSGGIIWVAGFSLLGYFLGTVPFVRANFEKVVIAIVFVSFLPSLYEIVQHQRNKKK